MTAITNELGVGTSADTTQNLQDLIKSWSIVELFTNVEMHPEDPEWPVNLYKSWISFNGGHSLLYAVLSIMPSLSLFWVIAPGR